jgi:hypothetical protein
MPTLAHEQRRRAETCRLQATKAPTEDHKAYWLRMANDWAKLAQARDPAERRMAEDKPTD